LWVNAYLYAQIGHALQNALQGSLISMKRKFVSGNPYIKNSITKTLLLFEGKAHGARICNTQQDNEHFTVIYEYFFQG
jgi:hypothetical protein